jgi:hypothetical protein
MLAGLWRIQVQNNNDVEGMPTIRSRLSRELHALPYFKNAKTVSPDLRKMDEEKVAIVRGSDLTVPLGGIERHHDPLLTGVRTFRLPLNRVSKRRYLHTQVRLTFSR